MSFEPTYEELKLHFKPPFFKNKKGF